MNKKIKRNVFMMVIWSALLLTGEATLRVYERLVHNVPLTTSINNFSHEAFGWTGKKKFGDPTRSPKRIFIIGDSFTEGCGVPEEEMYYAQLKDQTGAELFVYGGGGYGTLQEYLVLERYINDIKPTLIILQVSRNDFINNDLELERKSFLNNNFLNRPYWLNGSIEYHYPQHLGQWAKYALQFRVGYRLYIALYKGLGALADKGIYWSVEHDIEKVGRNHPDFRRAAGITEHIIENFKERAVPVPLVALNVNNDSPYLEEFRRIFKNTHIPLIDQAAAVIGERGKRGDDLFLEDGVHWNAQGHQIAGAILVRELREMGYLQEKNKKLIDRPVGL